MKSIQTFLEEFNCIPFEEKATILLQAWFRFFAIKHDQPENSNELFQKLIKDLKELAEYKESLENTYTESVVSNSNEEKEEPPQNSDIRELIKEECCVEASKEQKQNMEDTILELVKICRQKELLCIHDNVDDLIESALNSKLLSINSQRLDKKEQEVENVVKQSGERGNLHAVAPVLSNKEPEYSSSMGYENPNTTLETKSDEIINSGVEELVPILSENEVTLEDKGSVICPFVKILLFVMIILKFSPNPTTMMIFQFTMILKISNIVLREKLLSITRLIANIESLNDNPIPDCVLNSSVSIPPFKESNNSLLDSFSPEFKTFCDHSEETRSGNTTHADNSLPEYDSFCFEIEPDQERLVNVAKNDISDDSSSDSLLDEADLFLSDNLIPSSIGNFADDSEGDVRFLEELLIDDSIPFPNNESSESDFDNPLVPLPPSEPPDAETDAGDEILVVMNDELECLNPRDKLDDDDYFSFMIAKVFSLLSAEKEDTIFDPGEFKNEIQNTMKTQQTVLMEQRNAFQNNLQNMLSGFFQNQSLTSGTLPSNTIPNPKGEMKAITTWSGVSYEGPSIPTPKKVVEQETKETADKEQSNFQRSNAHIQPPATNQMEKYFQIFQDLHFDISFADALLLMLKFASTIKSLLTNKDKLFELAKILLNENCSVMLLKKLLEKPGDPCKFLIPFVDFEADPLVPLILGRSFLRTGRALIDVYGEELTLREILGFSSNSSGGSPTLTFEPIIFNSSPSLTPFKGKRDICLIENLLNDDPLQLPPMDLKDVIKAKSSTEERPEVELKDLPSHLEYAYLEKNYKKSPTSRVLTLGFVTQKILMEEDFKSSVQSQRRVNPKILEVIKKEVLKLLDARMIYPISDSPWVSPTHCVPKKIGITVVANEENELILTRLVTEWRVCIDYRKLNEATRKDHFPLLFMDQMLERLARRHKISKSGLEVNRAKVDVIAKLPHPTMVKGVRSFLGHADFYRRFIQDFSKIARPMTHLLEKETPFVFSKDCIDAFETPKKKLTEALILVVPD
uniref:Reverse transcriptase domain-containing protein n=1 Tax=Tanacetum cinerariifolium TaxID=118510 RepID=A0A6L2JTU0_TANCI|nr:hypothetical protein [Tanacetum cinerariifolium]